MTGEAVATPLFDTARIADHAAFLPPGQVAALLDAFVRELETRPALIAQRMRADDGAGVRAAAHLFKGASLSVGGTRVAQVAAAIERAAPHEVPALADLLAATARETLDAVRAVAASLAR